MLLALVRVVNNLRQNLKTGLNIPFAKVRQNGSVMRVEKPNKLVIAKLH